MENSIVFKDVGPQHFYKMIISLLKIIFSLANSADPDEMQPYVAFHLGLHCLPK